MTTPKGTALELLGQGQKLSSQSQNVESRIMVSIELYPATYAVMDTQSKGVFLAMSTLATVLRRVGRIHRHQLPTSVCRFVVRKVVNCDHAASTMLLARPGSDYVPYG